LEGKAAGARATNGKRLALEHREGNRKIIRALIRTLLEELLKQRIFSRNNRFRIVLLTVVFSAFAVYYKLVIMNPEGKKVARQLEAEFNSIPPYPSAKGDHPDLRYQGSKASVDSYYSVASDVSEIRRYYDAELQKRRWRFQSEEKLYDSGRDLGQSVVHYSKGDWTSSLQLINSDEKGETSYSFSLSWGLYR
jgi:hypothetical protein